MEGFLEETTRELRQTAEGRVLCAVSGGVDSSVASVLLNKALHARLQCVFIDTGLLRDGEGEEVSKFLRDDLGVPLEFVDASKRFLDSLKGVPIIVDPHPAGERARKQRIVHGPPVLLPPFEQALASRTFSQLKLLNGWRDRTPFIIRELDGRVA